MPLISIVTFYALVTSFFLGWNLYADAISANPNYVSSIIGALLWPIALPFTAYRIL